VSSRCNRAEAEEPSEMARIGLIAGNGRFPLLFAASARAQQHEVVAVAHVGETEREIEEYAVSTTWVRVGEIEKMIRAFQLRGVDRAVMAGGIQKASLFRNFCPDARAVAFLSRLPHWGDDAVLRAVAAELEREGIAVVDGTPFIAPLLAAEGLLAGEPPTEAQRLDVRLGLRVARAIGRWDIGQTVVVRDGVVLAVEAIEGTDAAIRRGAALAGRGTVVVKASKPGQDLRFDLPAVGLQTVAVCREQAVAVLAVEARRTLLLDREPFLRAARAGGLTVVGVSPED